MIDGFDFGNTEVGISWYGVVNLNRPLKRILISLNRFDFSKVVLDVNKIFIADNGDVEFLVVFKEYEAARGS